MKESQRKIRQEKLARLFYEMGMDINLINKISGIEKETILKFTKRKERK